MDKSANFGATKKTLEEIMKNGNIQLTAVDILQILQHSATREDISQLDNKLESKIDSNFKATREDISQLDNKLESKIDGNFRTLDSKIDNNFRILDSKIDTKFDTLDKKIDTKFDTLDKKIDTKFDILDKKIDDKFNILIDKIDAMSDKLDATNARFGDTEGKTVSKYISDEIGRSTDKITNKLNKLIGFLLTIGGGLSVSIWYIVTHIDKIIDILKILSKS